MATKNEIFVRGHRDIKIAEVMLPTPGGGLGPAIGARPPAIGLPQQTETAPPAQPTSPRDSEVINLCQRRPDLCLGSSHPNFEDIAGDRLRQRQERLRTETPRP